MLDRIDALLFAVPRCCGTTQLGASDAISLNAQPKPLPGDDSLHPKTSLIPAKAFQRQRLFASDALMNSLVPGQSDCPKAQRDKLSMTDTAASMFSLLEEWMLTYSRGRSSRGESCKHEDGTSLGATVRGREGLPSAARPRGGDWLEDEMAHWHHSGVCTVLSLLSPNRRTHASLHMKRIAILGSTGSIGRSTAQRGRNLSRAFPSCAALRRRSNMWNSSLELARRWKPRLISIMTAVDAEILRSRLQTSGTENVEVVHGRLGPCRWPLIRMWILWSARCWRGRAQSHLRSGTVGQDGRVGQQAMSGGSGRIDHRRGAPPGKPLLPIDSEHDAVHQCLRGGRMEEVDASADRLRRALSLHTQVAIFLISVAQALNHPTWNGA